MYRPQGSFNVAMKLLIPTHKSVSGVLTKTYPKIEDVGDEYLFFGDFKTFGGTENFSNDVYTLINTAVINTWYRPDIEADCGVCILSNLAVYDIVSDPENIEMKNQFLQFKVKKIGGKP